MASKRLNFTLDEGLYQRLKKFADREGISISEAIRRLILLHTDK